jgi:hypothetical protein
MLAAVYHIYFNRKNATLIFNTYKTKVATLINRLDARENGSPNFFRLVY